MKKKWIVTGVSACMVAAMLAGCGSSSKGGESQSGSSSASADGPVEVEFWYSGGKTAVNVVQEIVDSFNASQDKYVVKTVTQADYDETYSKLQAGIAGKAAPDVALIEVIQGQNLSDRGLLADLSGFIANDPDYNEEDYVKVFFDQGKSDDMVFAIPAYGTTQVCYYNIAAFEKAGIDPASIKTWQDLGKAAAAIKATGEYQYGWEPMWNEDNLIDIAYSNGGTMFNDDYTQVTINSPEWVESWDQIRKWIHEDQTMTVHFGGQGWEYWYNTIDDVLNNVAGGYTGSSGDQADLDFSIVAAMEQPAWDDDSASAPMAEAKLLSVLESSSDAEKQGAYDFIKYFIAPENQAKWNMETGYVAVNTKINDIPEYQTFLESHPQAAVPMAQVQHGSVLPIDPTGGAVRDALAIAADKIEIDNVPAQEALDEAQKTAQEALDAVNK